MEVKSQFYSIILCYLSKATLVWNLNGIHSIGQNLDCHTLTSALQETLTPSSAAGNGLYSVSKANKKFLDLLICTKGRVSTADILKQI